LRRRVAETHSFPFHLEPEARRAVADVSSKHSPRYPTNRSVPASLSGAKAKVWHTGRPSLTSQADNSWIAAARREEDSNKGSCSCSFDMLERRTILLERVTSELRVRSPRILDRP